MNNVSACQGENRCGIHSRKERLQSWRHGQNLRYLKLPFLALRRSFSGLSYMYIEIVHFSFLTCILQFKNFYRSSFCDMLKFLMTDRQTHWQMDQSLYPSFACVHGVKIHSLLLVTEVFCTTCTTIIIYILLGSSSNPAHPSARWTAYVTFDCALKTIRKEVTQTITAS